MQQQEMLKTISRELNLNYEPQDWGIINSDPNRVKEFILYYDNLTTINYSKYELFELIIASFNELVLENKNEKEINDFFVDFIKKNLKHPFIDILNYWSKIYNEQEFPVAKYFPSY